MNTKQIQQDGKTNKLNEMWIFLRTALNLFVVSSDINIQRIKDNTDSKEMQFVYLSVDADDPALLPTLPSS